MSRHKPRSDTTHIALNSPCYLPNTKHEPVHFIGSLHVRGSTLCQVPRYYYSQPKTYVPIPAANFFPSCWKNSFPAKIFQVAILTHTRARADPQDGFVSRQADTNQNQLQATPTASSLVFYFWFQGSFQIQLPDSIQKPTAKILFVFKDQTYFTLRQHANQFSSSFSQWIQSWCCCQENLLPDLLSCKTAGQALY